MIYTSIFSSLVIPSFEIISRSSERFVNHFVLREKCDFVFIAVFVIFQQTTHFRILDLKIYLQRQDRHVRPVGIEMKNSKSQLRGVKSLNWVDDVTILIQESAFLLINMQAFIFT